MIPRWTGKAAASVQQCVCNWAAVPSCSLHPRLPAASWQASWHAVRRPPGRAAGARWPATRRSTRATLLCFPQPKLLPARTIAPCRARPAAQVADGWRLGVSEGDAAARAAALRGAKEEAAALQARRMEEHERAMRNLQVEEQRLLLG